MIQKFLPKISNEENSFIVILEIQEETDGIQKRLDHYSNLKQHDRVALERYIQDLDTFREMLMQAEGDVGHAVKQYEKRYLK